MWQVLRLSPSPERARPYVEASERKLRDGWNQYQVKVGNQKIPTRTSFLAVAFIF